MALNVSHILAPLSVSVGCLENAYRGQPTSSLARLTNSSRPEWASETEHQDKPPMKSARYRLVARSCISVTVQQVPSIIPAACQTAEQEPEQHEAVNARDGRTIIRSVQCRVSSGSVRERLSSRRFRCTESSPFGLLGMFPGTCGRACLHSAHPFVSQMHPALKLLPRRALLVLFAARCEPLVNHPR